MRTATRMQARQECRRGRRREARLDETLVERLRAIGTVRLNEPVGRHTTFGIGGPADAFLTVSSAPALADAMRIARETNTPAFILGSGSNILVGDGGIRGIVIDNAAKATRIEPFRIGADSAVTAPDGAPKGDRHVVWAESGTSFAALARNLARQGYAGLEWASGIPGSLGGAAVYNAGAYGGCLADVLLAVSLVDGDGIERYLPAAELRMAYRTSALLRGEYGRCAVLTLELLVARGDARELTARVAEIDAARLAAQPRGRTGGSTFKNPPGRHAWELIDAVGLRGHRAGDAQVSEKHCNFFLNTGEARAADVCALMQEARTRVRERFGIELENEVELVGEGFA